MSVHVRLELEPPVLRWPQLPACRVTLVNGGGEALRDINVEDPRGRAVLELTDLATGEQTEIAAPILDPSVFLLSEPCSLEPGAQLEDAFYLGRRLSLPRPGRYRLRARFRWDDGEARSDAVPFEVQAAPAAALAVEPERGGPMSALVCAWNDRDAGTMRLTSIAQQPAPAAGPTVDLARTAALAAPILSVPADRLPGRQYVAWIVDRELGYAVHEHGAIERGQLDLQASDWRLIGPACELSTEAPGAPDAELLLLRDEGSRWRLRAIRLVQAAVLGADVVVSGPAPAWARVVHRPDGERRVFAVASASGATSLWRGSWSPGRGPTRLRAAIEGPGRLLAAAAQLGAGGCSVGAALVAVATPRGRLHALWSWSLAEDDAFAHRTTELTCLADASVDEAFVAVDQRGSAAVLARRAEAWSFVDAGRPDVAVPAPALASPLQLSFLRGRTPVVVYAEPEQGLFVRPLVDLPPFLPPT
ncbi:hypothetical protein WME75_43400 [Sorangium sp. So ce1014]|uniref:hypothetical protein n=1 Tax=Sorangium sp. So ce1014 TaxID=3133326 RepID=UPI003F5D9F9D